MYGTRNETDADKTWYTTSEMVMELRGYVDKKHVQLMVRSSRRGVEDRFAIRCARALPDRHM